MVGKNEIESPRLRALSNSENIDQALSSFWSEIESNGAPLIEEIEGDESHKLVTFIVRKEAGIERAAVASAVTGYYTTFENTVLSHLVGTDIMYRSVRVRNRTRTMYQLAVNYHEEPALIGSNWIQYAESWKPDPLNKNIQPFDLEKDGFGWADRVFSILELPDAFEDEYSFERGVPQGERLEFTLEDNLGQSREIWAYLPHGYDDKEKYPLLVFTDGWIYFDNMRTPTILDNLIAEGKIPPVIALFVNHPHGMRSKELYIDDNFINFFSTRFVDWLESQFSVSTAENRILVGNAAGGVFATYFALKHPDIFGGVISSSASFQYRGPDNGEPGWVIREYVEKERQNIRFYIDIGTLEQDPAVDNGGN
ncbi:MAG: alpha/beta hydrolase-fold protein, partial [Candidatus Kariarchaeaceae archaeon]